MLRVDQGYTNFTTDLCFVPLVWATWMCTDSKIVILSRCYNSRSKTLAFLSWFSECKNFICSTYFCVPAIRASTFSLLFSVFTFFLALYHEKQMRNQTILKYFLHNVNLVKGVKIMMKAEIYGQSPKFNPSFLFLFCALEKRIKLRSQARLILNRSKIIICSWTKNMVRVKRDMIYFQNTG